MSPVRVAVDAMGGDQAPGEIVAGALEAASADVQPVLFGRRAEVSPLAGGLEVIHAPDVVEMDEKPSDSARDKRSSSMFAACRAVAEGEAEAGVFSGHTGGKVAARLVEV